MNGNAKKMVCMKRSQKRSNNEEKTDLKTFTFDMVEAVIFAFSLVIIIFTFIVRSATVDGPSMEPTLHDGDRLIISRMFYKPKNGDIVVCAVPDTFDEPIIKRVIATEGQTISIDYSTGNVFVDGILLNEDYIKDLTTRPGTTQFPVTVGKNEVFVMGDNRLNSHDSKNEDVGCISVDNVIGKLYVRLFPNFTTY